MSSLVPKGCIVHSIRLDGRGSADVGYRCADDRGQHSYAQPGGGTGNYPHKRVKASSVSFRGVTVSGDARLGFVLSPASAVCSKSGREISCRLKGDTSSKHLSGAGRRRKKRSRR